MLLYYKRKSSITQSQHCHHSLLCGGEKHRDKKGAKMLRKFNAVPLGMASALLCIAAECRAGAADSQANPFVSCHLSLTTESKRNGRLYRGLLFHFLYPIVLVHYITSSFSFTHSALSWLVFCSFSKAAKSCGFTLASPRPPSI